MSVCLGKYQKYMLDDDDLWIMINDKKGVLQQITFYIIDFGS